MTTATLDASYVASLEARIAALEARAPEGLLSSKTLRFWLALLAIAFGAITLAALADHYLGITTPYLSNFFDLIGLGGGATTARNVTADHIMPAMQTWKTAQASNPPPSTSSF